LGDASGVACAPLTPLYLPASQPTAFPPSPIDLLQYYHFAPIARVPSVSGPGLYRGAIRKSEFTLVHQLGKATAPVKMVRHTTELPP
jgi:hypothetical protein